MNDNNLIELQNMSKQYHLGDIQVAALNNINLKINAGEYVAILGPSGSGKSTLMNILGCLDSPTAGHYLLKQQDVSHLRRNQLAHVRNHTIGFVFQNFNLLEYASALENVAVPLLYRGINWRARDKQAATMLERVGLGDRFQHKPNELSGGQRQRVAIARALVTSPDLLLADEPTGNLDSQSGQEVIALFEELASENKTVIIVTHDEKLAQRTRRILRICDGQLESDEKV